MTAEGSNGVSESKVEENWKFQRKMDRRYSRIFYCSYKINKHNLKKMIVFHFHKLIGISNIWERGHFVSEHR